jgi:hypothetical protein
LDGSKRKVREALRHLPTVFPGWQLTGARGHVLFL